MRPTIALVLALSLRGVPALAADDCAELRAAAEKAASDLESCLEIGLGECADEEAAREEADRKAAGCQTGTSGDPLPAPDPLETPAAVPGETPDPPEVAPTPAPEPPPPAAGRVALVVEGIEDPERGALLLVAQSALQGAELIDSGAIRAARAFSGDAPLDATSEQKLRVDLNADRLIALHVKVAGAVRYLAMRVHDATGETHQRFAEANESDLGSHVERMIREVPPLAATATAPPIATAPTPEPPSDPFEPPLPAFGPAPAPVRPPAGPPYVDVNAFGGSKSLATSDWAPLASHGEGGVMATIGAGDWPVHVALDGYYSFASGDVSGVAVRTTTWEAGLGARKIFDTAVPMIRPHAGAGLAVIGVANTAEVGTRTESAGGSGFGFWLGGGAFVRLPGSVNLGLQVRYSAATVSVNDADVQAGGFHVGATLGVGIGSASSR